MEKKVIRKKLQNGNREVVLMNKLGKNQIYANAVDAQKLRMTGRKGGLCG